MSLCFFYSKPNRLSFHSNKVSEGTNGHGGALFIGNGAGVVNVVNGHFSNNQALSGGAIFSQAYMLNVVGSKFIMNQAITTVSLTGLAPEKYRFDKSNRHLPFHREALFSATNNRIS
jgi:predicted outer membrane repeat protein